LSAQDASVEDVATDELAQEAEAQDADAQDALAQDAVFQEAEAHEAEAHEALFQEASAVAALAQLAASNTRPEPPAGSDTTYLSSAKFGFGGELTAAALPALTSPTPRDMGDALGGATALTMSAPLTWSGVKLGCSAST